MASRLRLSACDCCISVLSCSLEKPVHQSAGACTAFGLTKGLKVAFSNRLSISGFLDSTVVQAPSDKAKTKGNRGLRWCFMVSFFLLSAHQTTVSGCLFSC